MGWNGSGGAAVRQTGTKTPVKGRSSSLRSLMFVFCVIGIVIAGGWLAMTAFTAEEKPQKPKKTAEKYRSHPKSADKQPASLSWVAEATATERKAGTVAKPTVAQTATNEQSEAELDAEAEAEVTGSKDLKGINAADQMILTLLAAPPGQEHAPLPDNAVSEAEFDRSLKHEIVLRDNDSTAVRHMKETLIEVRREIQELRKEGRTVNSILQQFRDESNESLNLRAIASREAQKIIDGGDRDGAQEYVTALNEQFGRMGIDPIEMPLAGEEAEAAAAAAEENAAVEAEAEAEERADIERRKEAYKQKKLKERANSK